MDDPEFCRHPDISRAFSRLCILQQLWAYQALLSSSSYNSCSCFLFWFSYCSSTLSNSCRTIVPVLLARTKLLFLVITRVVTGHLSNEPPQQSNIPFDSAMLGDDAFKCAYLVDAAGEGNLCFMKLGLEIGKRGRRRWGCFWKVLVLHRGSNRGIRR